MKRLLCITLGLGLAAFSARAADVNIGAVASDAAENTFAGRNYSWSSLVTRPDQTAVDVVGQTSQGATAVSVKEGTRSFQSIVVDDTRFVFGEDGWKKLPAHNVAEDRPPHFEGQGGPGRPFGPHAFFSPAENLSHLFERITSWSTQGDVLVGTFSGAAHPGRVGNESLVLNLWVQNGLVTKAQITATHFPPEGASLANQPKTETTTTTISAVGSTTVTLPSDVQVLLTSS